MKKSVQNILLILILTTFSGFLSILFYNKFVNQQEVKYIYNSPPPSSQLTKNVEIENHFTSFEVAAEMSVNAVVHIKTESIVRGMNDPLYEFFYGRSRHPSQTIQSSGSGVIISDDGYIVTNNHVVSGAENIEVVLNNKKTYNAEIIGTDPNTDLALLKIESNNLPFINYGNSNNLKIGQWVLAVGNPFNLTSTVTAGIVSAKGRDINIIRNDPYTGVPAIESFIQTDAAVNPGNSGGALVNTHGELVGINTAIQSNTGSYTGYSFAIPANIVKKVVSDLKEFGTVQRAFIGVSIRKIDEELAKKLNLEDLSGVYVNGVTKNGSAAKAGVKSGDIIKKVGNKTINDVPELQEQIGQFRPGDKIHVIVERDGKLVNIPITLKNLNGDEELLTNEENNVFEKLGAQLVELNEKDLKRLNLESGIKVEQIYNGKLRAVGVREGFIITKVNHQKIETLKELTKVVNSTKGGILVEGIYENGKKEFYGFGV
ncbi:MAG: Do family serine endopeptidase [Flavobacteriales bacterium]|nr:Do family serine endopeptidase [Flavobacteriales bacterium]